MNNGGRYDIVEVANDDPETYINAIGNILMLLEVRKLIIEERP